MDIEELVGSLSKKLDDMTGDFSEVKGDVKSLLTETRNLSKGKNNHEARIYHIEQNYVTKADLQEIKTDVQEIRTSSQKVRDDTTINTTKIVMLASVGSLLGGGLVTFFFAILLKVI